MKESPIFTKTYDLLLWLIPQVVKFPRAHRFGVGERTQRLALNFQDTLVAAGKSQGGQRLVYLKTADIHLEQLRLWIRFSRDNEFINIRQYEHVSRMMADLGRLLGAWLKHSV
jgi:hypothetical protein